MDRNMDSFYSHDEVQSLGLRHCGDNVLISRKTSFYSPEKMSIGNNVRIDDYCILSGEIQIGNNIHISAYVGLYGKYGIRLADFTTVSGRNLIYSSSDDFSGEYLTNPMVPDQYTHVTGGRVTLEKHVIIGAGSVTLPNVTLKEGSAVGAMSLVNKSTDPWFVYGGVPIRKLYARKTALLDLENKYVTERDLGGI